MKREVIMEIVRDACRAPSGDNTQPWRFSVHQQVIRVINVPEKDTSLFNWRQITNHVALGAAIENLGVSAQSKGFRADVQLFPDPSNNHVIAEVILTEDASAHTDLAPYIIRRASNRKRYLPRVIEREKLEQLEALAEGDPCRIVCISDTARVHHLARIVSLGEKVALGNRAIHDFLFSHVTWSKEEDDKIHGFYIDTFEFTPVQKMAFKLFSNWHILKLFLSLGISNVIARDAEKLHKTSAAFGAIIVPNREKEDFVKAGMLLERFWLTATKLGLAFQPTTTVHYIGSRILGGDPGDINEEHQQMLREGYAELADVFQVSDTEGFGLVFRLGYADPPSAVTTRTEPEIVFED